MTSSSCFSPIKLYRQHLLWHCRPAGLNAIKTRSALLCPCINSYIRKVCLRRVAGGSRINRPRITSVIAHQLSKTSSSARPNIGIHFHGQTVVVFFTPRVFSVANFRLDGDWWRHFRWLPAEGFPRLLRQRLVPRLAINMAEPPTVRYHSYKINIANSIQNGRIDTFHII